MNPIPPRPDFDTMEAAAAGKSVAERRTRILSLIGSLIVGWSNNESMLVYLIMLLMRTDEPSAALVFSTLNTTRARVDLVQRLAKVHVRDAAMRRRLEEALARLGAAGALRNEINHSIYSVNEAGDLTHTRSLKVTERRGKLELGHEKPLDAARITELTAAAKDLRDLNRDLWALIGDLDQHLRERTSNNHRRPR
jgi:hypothetical protein